MLFWDTVPKDTWNGVCRILNISSMWLKVLYCSVPHKESPGTFYDNTQEITLNLVQIILIYYEPMMFVKIYYCQEKA